MEKDLGRSDRALELLRREAPRRAPNVRVLAAFSGHTDCNLASLGFATSVDFDKLLNGTGFEAPFGQSPFAFSRGTAFERIIAEGGYGATLELLRTTMGFSVTDARIVNLRDAYANNSRSMILRAHDTKSLVAGIVRGDPSAPNLIDGAVLSARIGGVRSNFEADALAARFGGLIHAGEVKSFPVVDGHADQDKVGAALDQVAIYIYLARHLVAEVGGDPSLVSSQAMLITPKNVRLSPTLSVMDVSRRVDRTEILLSRVPSIEDVAAEIPTGASFGRVADREAPEERRIDHLHMLAEEVGTTYHPSCLSTCGLARFCRARAFRTGDLELVGSEAVRLLPGIQSLARAAELSDGAPPSLLEAPAARHLARAARLYDEFAEPARAAVSDDGLRGAQAMGGRR